MTEPHWTQVFAALLTPTIAVFGLFIAYRQWLMAQKKLKCELRAKLKRNQTMGYGSWQMDF